MEVSFGQLAYSSMFDGFMRHYLIVKTGEIPNLGDVYAAFKIYAMSSRVAQEGVEALVSDLKQWAQRFCRMALGQEPDHDLRISFQDLRELRVDVAYPLLLELYEDYEARKLTRDDFLSIIRFVESYVFRRAICAIPTNSLTKTFTNLARSIRKERYLESLKAQLLLLRSYRRFPDNDEFRRALLTRDLYHMRVRSYALRKLENHGRKEPVRVDEFTIEHILPQNENLSAVWRVALGSEWQKVQQTWLHTIGNLTLTGYNSEYSDLPFAEKRDMEGGFHDSPLRLNAGLGQLDLWNEDAIKNRAEQLAKKAEKIWEYPLLESGTLEAYRPTESRGITYTIDDHPYLSSGESRRLFEAFRREVLALDPCVAEEFLKYYVAYKAETNFVDVYPQAARLRLIINLPFDEIVDPQGICSNVAGYRLNGEVRVNLTSIDGLSYIVGLVRQALERQMGSVDA
jgi:predicted transport protein